MFAMHIHGGRVSRKLGISSDRLSKLLAKRCK